MVEQRPYGTWPSPVTSRDVARVTGLRRVSVDGTGTVWWEESSPAEDGRRRVMRRAPEHDAAEVVAEGAGPWMPLGDDVLVAEDDTDGRLYLMRPGAPPRPLTPPGAGTDHHHDLVRSPDGTEVWCVRASQRGDLVERSLVAVPLDGSAAIRTLVPPPGPVSTPRPSPDGKLLAWVAWDHPQMPWDGSQLRVARLTSAGASDEHVLLGGAAESVFQPEWATTDSLHVVSDRTRWGNLYEIGLDGALRPLCPWAEEFGWAQHRGDLSTYARVGDGRLAVLHGTDDRRLDLVDPVDDTLVPLDLPYDAWAPSVCARGRHVVGIAGGPARPAAVVRLDTADGRLESLRQSEAGAPVEYLPRTYPATFSGRDGHDVHAVVYPPYHPHVRAADRERVPYLLFLAGPGAQATRMYDPVKAFFTSRGLGVAEVRCRGSSGYGRGYREEVYGRWGAADVEDCAVVVRGLVERWRADPVRVAARGAGAGATTALGTLAGTDVCAAATAYAPIADLGALTSPEAGYLREIASDSALARSRGWLERIRRPVLVLHGERDQVVPVAQGRLVRDTLRRSGVPCTYLEFHDEGHALGRADAVDRALQAELRFYVRVLGLDGRTGQAGPRS